MLDRMRSYSRGGWAVLLFGVLISLWLLGAGIWMLEEHPDSLFGLVLIGAAVFAVASLRDTAILADRDLSEQERSDELVRSASSGPAFALGATAFALIGVAAGAEVLGTAGALAWGCWGVALVVWPHAVVKLLRPSPDDPERPSRWSIVAFAIGVVLGLVALVGFFAAVIYAFFGGPFVWIWLGGSTLAVVGAAVLFLFPLARRDRGDA
jgi:hypothetical protein